MVDNGQNLLPIRGAMIIREVKPIECGVLQVVAEDGRFGTVDVSPYLDSMAFSPLKNWDAFIQVRNGKYYVEWTCGADLSADTLEAKMQWTTLVIKGNS